MKSLLEFDLDSTTPSCNCVFGLSFFSFLLDSVSPQICYMTSSLQNYCKSSPFIASLSIFGPWDANIPIPPSASVAPVTGCLLFILHTLLLLCFVYYDNVSFPFGRPAPSLAEGFVPGLVLLYDIKLGCFHEFSTCTSCFCTFYISLF